jgi:hypothetical protein
LPVVIETQCLRQPKLQRRSLRLIRYVSVLPAPGALESRAILKPDMVAEAKRLRRRSPKGHQRSLRDVDHQGWVLIAFQNAFCHLAKGTTLENALIETVGKGGEIPILMRRSAARYWVLP